MLTLPEKLEQTVSDLEDMISDPPSDRVDEYAMICQLRDRLTRIADDLLVNIVDDDADEVRGQRFGLVRRPPRTDRKYATERLLLAIGGDPVNGVLTVLREGLGDISWSWSKLRAYAQRSGMPLGVWRDDEEWKGAGDPHVTETRKRGSWMPVEIEDE